MTPESAAEERLREEQEFYDDIYWPEGGPQSRTYYMAVLRRHAATTRDLRDIRRYYPELMRGPV